MAKKKVAKKTTPQIKKTTSTSKVEQVKFSFQDTKEGMSNEEKLKVHQHNMGQLYSYQNLLVGTTKLTDKESFIASTVNKVLLIDRKLILIGSEINRLSQMIEESSSPKEEKSPEITM